MKITSIDSFILTVPTPKPMALNYAQQKLVVAEISTDEGIAGLGYSLVFGGGGAEAVLVYLETRLRPVVLGEDPLFVERLWERMFRADMGIKKQGVAAYALSALDIGLWDIAGKAAGLPLYRLWGAVTDRVPAYGSGGGGLFPNSRPARARHGARPRGEGKVSERLRSSGCPEYQLITNYRQGNAPAPPWPSTHRPRRGVGDPLVSRRRHPVAVREAPKPDTKLSAGPVCMTWACMLLE